jgi:acylphosphatase
LTVVRKRIWASGLVQGVSYRANAYDEAVRLGLRGWVRNRRDGRVEALVEGSDHAIAEFVVWCKQGPPAARVTAVDVENDITTESLDAFEVRPTR